MEKELIVKRILIVEDHEMTRDMLKKHAAKLGYEVVAATDGLQYLTTVSKEKFDLIITDLKMPDLDGASATDIMKIQGDSTPVLAITGLSQEDTKQIRDKFTEIYYKPLDITNIFETIEVLLR